MKAKSIAVLAITGVLAMSLITPAAAADDYMGNNNPSGQSTQQPANGTMPNQSNDMLGNTPQNDNMNDNNSSNDVSPDTATGDDDY